eukprot:8213067-Lingulodinium_polyedra.AAC.1
MFSARPAQRRAKQRPQRPRRRARQSTPLLPRARPTLVVSRGPAVAPATQRSPPAVAGVVLARCGCRRHPSLASVRLSAAAPR